MGPSVPKRRAAARLPVHLRESPGGGHSFAGSPAFRLSLGRGSPESVVAANPLPKAATSVVISGSQFDGAPEPVAAHDWRRMEPNF